MQIFRFIPDTNILIDFHNEISKIINQTRIKINFYIPRIVLVELDGLKKNNTNARKAIKMITNNITNENIFLEGYGCIEKMDIEVCKESVLDKHLTAAKKILNDDRILKIVKENPEFTFLTRDRCLHLKALGFNIKSILLIRFDLEYIFIEYAKLNDTQSSNIIRLKDLNKNIVDFADKYRTKKGDENLNPQDSFGNIQDLDPSPELLEIEIEPSLERKKIQQEKIETIPEKVSTKNKKKNERKKELESINNDIDIALTHKQPLSKEDEIKKKFILSNFYKKINPVILSILNDSDTLKSKYELSEYKDIFGILKFVIANFNYFEFYISSYAKLIIQDVLNNIKNSNIEDTKKLLRRIVTIFRIDNIDL